MSQQKGTLLSNKKNQQQSPVGGKSKFRTKGLTGGPDTAPGGDMGKGMGTMKPKQAKYGKKPDADGVGTSSTKGVRFDAAIHRSGGQQN